MDLSGRNFIITGGAGGLGSAVTKEFLDAGAGVAVTYVVKEQWDELQAEISGASGRLISRHLDATDHADLQKAMATIHGQLGEVHGLVHLVGGFSYATVEATEPGILERMLSLNFRSTFLTCRAVIPLLRQAGSGKILCVSARAALKGTAGLSAYSASKAAVITLVQAMDDELRDENIQVNCVLPSIIDTPANREAMPDADPSRWVQPEQIARVLRFLASSDADVISGAAIPVYGRA